MHMYNHAHRSTPSIRDYSTSSREHSVRQGCQRERAWQNVIIELVSASVHALDFRKILTRSGLHGQITDTARTLRQTRG